MVVGQPVKDQVNNQKTTKQTTNKQTTNNNHKNPLTTNNKQPANKKTCRISNKEKQTSKNNQKTKINMTTTMTNQPTNQPTNHDKQTNNNHRNAREVNTSKTNIKKADDNESLNNRHSKTCTYVRTVLTYAKKNSDGDANLHKLKNDITKQAGNRNTQQ